MPTNTPTKVADSRGGWETLLVLNLQFSKRVAVSRSKRSAMKKSITLRRSWKWKKIRLFVKTRSFRGAWRFGKFTVLPYIRNEGKARRLVGKL